MKRTLSVIVILLCLVFAFAGEFKPYVTKLSKHSAFLGGINLTHIGAGVKYPVSLPNGEVINLDANIAGGLSERTLYQNPKTGDYLEKGSDKVQLFDAVNLEWSLGGEYDYNENLKISFGLDGNYEKRQDSVLITGKYWPKKQSMERFLGGNEKRTLNTTVAQWIASFGANNAYPEFEHEKSLFTGVRVGAVYNDMIDTMVANDGYIASLDLAYVPGFINKDADFVKAHVDVLYAKQLIDMRKEDGLNLFALSVLDRLDVIYAGGKKIPTYYQSDISLGRRIRGLAFRSYARTFTVANNLELRLSSPELREGLFARLNLFLDCGLAAGNKINSSINDALDLVASTGAQIAVDYNDSIDIGFEVAYLLKGYNASDPSHKLQTGIILSLDY